MIIFVSDYFWNPIFDSICGYELSIFAIYSLLFTLSKRFFIENIPLAHNSNRMGYNLMRNCVLNIFNTRRWNFNAYEVFVKHDTHQFIPLRVYCNANINAKQKLDYMRLIWCETLSAGDNGAKCCRYDEKKMCKRVTFTFLHLSRSQ